MTPLDVIARVRAAGGAITVNNGRLKVVSPPQVFRDLRPSLIEHKSILIRLLATTQEPVTEIEQSESSNVENCDAIIVRPGTETGDELNEQNELSALQPAAEIRCELNELCDQGYADAEPCRRCGSLLLWWDALGGVHCESCEPPVRSRFIAARVQSLLVDYAAGKYPTKNPRFHATKQQLEPSGEPAPGRSREQILSRIFAAWDVVPKYCPDHRNPAKWQEAPVTGKRIRVMCSTCGGFVGYRNGEQVVMLESPEGPCEEVANGRNE
jgi:hypothetical protein